jgi:subtilisin family serine protease
MLAVGAVDSLGFRAGFSSIGPTADGRTKPDVMAQGVSVLIASASGQPDSYAWLSGTSFSCPLTAGVAACLIQARPRWSLTQLVHAMKSSASRAANPDDYYGWGLVDAAAALNADTVGVPDTGVPLQFALRPGSVNPMRLGSTSVSFGFGMGHGAEPAEYSIRIYDVTGRVVRTLWNGWLGPGGVGPPVRWDGTDGSGRRARPGLYFASLRSSDRHATIRIVATP